MATHCTLRLTEGEHNYLKSRCHVFAAWSSFTPFEDGVTSYKLDFTLPFKIKKVTVVKTLVTCAAKDLDLTSLMEHRLQEVIRILDYFGGEEVFDLMMSHALTNMPHATIISKLISSLFQTLGNHPWLNKILAALKSQCDIELDTKILAKLSSYELYQKIRAHYRCANYGAKTTTFYCDFCSQSMVVYLLPQSTRYFNKCTITACCGTPLHKHPACLQKYLLKQQCKFCTVSLQAHGEIEKHDNSIHQILQMVHLRDRHGIARHEILAPPVGRADHVTRSTKFSNKVNVNWKI